MLASALLLASTAVYQSNFALSFNAAKGDVLRVPQEASMGAPLIDSFTVEMWVKASKKQKEPSDGGVVNLLGFPGRHPFVGLAADTGCAVVQLKLTNGSWYSYEGTTAIDDDKWHHVAATWDGTSANPAERELALYVDGVLEPSGGDEDDSLQVPKRPESAGHQVVRTCSNDLCEEGMHIGGLYCCSGKGYTGRYFNGTLDEVRVWTRALPQAELARKRSVPLAAGDETGLLFYFPLDEAGMETGANVVESRALPWYAILGNAQGGGRPAWTVSSAPLTCAVDSHAPICKRIDGVPESFAATQGSPAYGRGVAALYGSTYEGDDEASVSAMMFLVFVIAAMSAGVAATVTYTSIKGELPPSVAKASDAIMAVPQWVSEKTGVPLNGGGPGYAAAAAGSGGAGDWRWASPPREGEPAEASAAGTPPSAPPPQPPPASGSSAVSSTYGGL